ncbi:phospholipase [Jeotgalibacillus proteolyticus]|uniref:phospholipase n=1 Tax=Jeotgalibacillus proteolyticus TaxID=2082395 RepID=UPI003CEABA78
MMDRRRNRPGLCLFPGYNWCGPGCSGPGAPVNEVDACCKAHDECYGRGGSRCECDRAFLEQLAKHANPHTEQGRKAALMYDFIKFRMAFTCGGR